MKKPVIALLGGVIALAGLAEAQTVRICFGTTTNVRNSVGGTRNANSLLNTKFSTLQQAFGESRSATGVTFTRPGHFSSTYNNRRQTASTQIRRLRSGSELRGFRNHRDRNNADLAQLYCDWTNTSVKGVGQLPGFASVVLNSVLSVNSGSTPQRATHIHEVGHTMNATHGAGFCLARNERTIMEPNSSSCRRSTRVLYFSDDRRRKNGNRLGNRSNDNRGRIQARARTTSRQR